MNKKLVILFSLATLLVLPIAAFAFNPGSTPAGANFDATTILQKILDFIWILFAGMAVIMFIVAGFLFLMSRQAA